MPMSSSIADDRCRADDLHRLALQLDPVDR
jgi:hypothetical protein